MTFNQGPESNSREQDLDLDFTGPAMEIAELEKKIAATERGIKLAASLNDPGRVQEMETRKAAFEADISKLKTPEKPQEVQKNDDRFEVADMSDSTTRRLDARGNV